MKKHILLVMALFGVLTVGSCNDDEPVVSPIPGEDEEVVIPAPEPINPVLVQTLYFDFGSVGGEREGLKLKVRMRTDTIGITFIIMMGFMLLLTLYLKTLLTRKVLP